jgi:hypothetical protein
MFLLVLMLIMIALETGCEILGAKKEIKESYWVHYLGYGVLSFYIWPIGHPL